MPGANPHLLRSLVIKEHHLRGVKKGEQKSPTKVSIGTEGEHPGKSSDTFKTNIGESILRRKGFGKKKQ